MDASVTNKGRTGNKYDWMALKQEFLQSDCKTVQDFVRRKQLPWNGNTSLKMAGWSNAKAQVRLETEQKANQKIAIAIEEKADEIAEEHKRILSQQ
jgi:hypothetical protein